MQRSEILKVAQILLLAASLVIAILLLWHLIHELLLLFGAILVAVLLRALADPIERITPLSGRLSVGLAVLLIGGAIAGFLWLLGGQVQTQTTLLLENLPDLVEQAESRLGFDGLGDWIEEQRLAILEDGSLMVDVASYSTRVIAAGAETIVVLAAGIYLAFSPRLYLEGLLKLIPDRRQQEARDTLEAVGRALKLWLLGQLAAMALVGLLTSLGLWLLGVPSALALGFIAGLFEFVPFVGPVASAVPALIVALADGHTTALWVMGLYVLIQQAEGILITPLVQQYTVDLPPVLTIFAIIAFGTLFGALGLLLATPLAVVCLVLVKKLWVREVLHEAVSLPGEDNETTARDSLENG